MEKKYFKKYNKGTSLEWTVYGEYAIESVMESGDVICIVDDITIDPKANHITHTKYKSYVELDEVEHISPYDYYYAIAQIEIAEALYRKADERLMGLV